MADPVVPDQPNDKWLLSVLRHNGFVISADRIEALVAERDQLAADVHANAKTFAALIAEERAKTAGERQLADQLASAIGMTVSAPTWWERTNLHHQKTNATKAALAAREAARSTPGDDPADEMRRREEQVHHGSTVWKRSGAHSPLLGNPATPGDDRD